MHNDNTYIENRFGIGISAEPDQKHKLEVEKVILQTPLLQEVIAHLADKIAATDSVKNALNLANKYEVDNDTALIVCDVLRAELEGERNWIEAKIRAV